jgi:hypothetical protein
MESLKKGEQQKDKGVCICSEIYMGNIGCNSGEYLGTIKDIKVGG